MFVEVASRQAQIQHPGNNSSRDPKPDQIKGTESIESRTSVPKLRVNRPQHPSNFLPTPDRERTVLLSPITCFLTIDPPPRAVRLTEKLPTLSGLEKKKNPLNTIQFPNNTYGSLDFLRRSERCLRM